MPFHILERVFIIFKCSPDISITFASCSDKLIKLMSNLILQSKVYFDLLKFWHWLLSKKMLKTWPVS